MKKIADLLRESNFPLMIYLNQAETASAAEVVTSAFKDKKAGYTFVTNLTEPKSLAGESAAPVKIEGVEQKIDVASLTTSNDVALMIDSEGNRAYVGMELAFDLAAEVSFKSPITGNEVTLAYVESADEDTSTEGESEGEDESTEEDTSDSDDTGAEDSEGEDEIITVNSVEDVPADDEGESEDEGEDDSLEGDDEDTSEDDESEDEEMADKPADTSTEEDAGEEEDVNEVKDSEVEVSLLDMADDTKAIRLIPLAQDNSEIAVFVGGLPVGSLAQTKAVESAAFLYDEPKKLFHTFKDQFKHAAKNGSFGELAKLGFEPYVGKTTVSALVEKYIAQETASVRAEIATERTGGTERHKRIVKLSMVGILKGLHEKGMNPLVKEVSSLLRQAGHQSPELAARRAMHKASGEFAKVVFERADALEKESDDYLNGITDTVAQAEFKAGEGESTEGDVGSKVTTLYGGEKQETASEGFHSSFAPKKTEGNKFSGVVAGIGQRGFGRR